MSHCWPIDDVLAGVNASRQWGCPWQKAFPIIVNDCWQVILHYLAASYIYININQANIWLVDIAAFTATSVPQRHQIGNVAILFYNRDSSEIWSLICHLSLGPSEIWVWIKWQLGDWELQHQLQKWKHAAIVTLVRAVIMKNVPWSQTHRDKSGSSLR